MAFTMANKKNINSALSVNQITPGTQVKGGYGTRGSHPPRNMMGAMAHMVPIATYSPSMNIIYGVEPYSTMKPATSSDSASTRSNGGRLVSASAEMKNTMYMGNSGSQNQFSMVNQGRPSRFARPRFSWAATIAVRLSEPTHKSTVII